MANRVRIPPSLQHQEQYYHHHYPKDKQVFLPNQDPFSDAHSTGHRRMPSTLPPPVPARGEVRAKMSRAQSGTVPPAMNRDRPQRSLSEDSGSLPVDRSRDRTQHSKSKPAGNPAKKEKHLASAHADVIDKLDISGAGMFHHDGPFDAAAPSRNKQKNHRAPMFAFNGDPSQSHTMPAPHNVPVMDKRLSPLAQATIAAMANSSDPHGPYGAVGSGPYPSIGNAPPEPNALYPLLSPRKTTLAEAWGKAEPEPFEEFSAGTNTIGRSPANSIDGGYEGFYSRKQEAKARGAHPDSGAPAPRRNKIPPPKPIHLPGSGGSLPSSPTTSPTNETFGGLPSSPNQHPPVMKRTKSLMQRIRKMRDNPNVPLGSDANNGYAEVWTPGTPGVPEEDTFSAPESSRHAAAAASRQPMSRRRPSGEDGYYSDRRAAAAPAHTSRNKALPPPPPIPSTSPKDEGSGYFEQPRSSNIGRKPSLYQKVKGAVAGGNKTR